MRWVLAAMWVTMSLGCVERVIDPALGHREPAVESHDAAIEEDAAMAEPPPLPVPDWAVGQAPLPAMPPPPLD